MRLIADSGLRACTRPLRVRSGLWSCSGYEGRHAFSSVNQPSLAQQDLADEQPHGAHHGTNKSGGEGDETQQEGAMSRRLADMSEASLETGSRNAHRVVEEARFDESLKRQLEERLAGAQFREDHRSALAQVQMPAAAGQGSKHIAGAQPWKGEETIEDAALRMLTDAHKPLRGTAKIPSPRGPPTKIDTGRPKVKASSGARLASARDKTSIYSFLKDPNMSEKEREQMRKELKDRFTPAARAVPATIQGLASLANERIEDAIARGQFKNLPRGKKIERDYNASSPFLDTTVC
jgi:hypothetical protein